MKSNLGYIYALILATKDMLTHVDTPFLFQPPPECLNNDVMDTFQKNSRWVNCWIYVGGKGLSISDSCEVYFEFQAAFDAPNCCLDGVLPASFRSFVSIKLHRSN
jgi:hypothetical protein